MRHDEQTTETRQADGDVASFSDRVIRVRAGYRKRIEKYRPRFIEGYAMLAQVGGGFFSVPFELQHRICPLPKGAQEPPIWSSRLRA